MDRSKSKLGPGDPDEDPCSHNKEPQKDCRGTEGYEKGGSQASKLQFELDRYKQEVRYLKGRIQGYQTLSSLLQEEKHESRKYRQLYEEAAARFADLKQVMSMEPSLLLSSLNSAKSIDFMQREEQNPGSSSSAGNPVVPTGHRSRSTGQASVASENEEPPDMETNQTEVVPASDKRRDGEELTSVSSSVYQSNTFEKIGGTESLEIDPYDQYTVPGGFTAEGISRTAAEQDISQAASSSIEAIPSGGSSPTGAQLISQVQEISNALTRGVGLTVPSQLSTALARLAIDVLKVEKQMRLKQVMINNLCPENEQLKTRLQKMIEERDSCIQQLKEEKDALQKRNAVLERLVRSLPQNSTLSTKDDPMRDWVHVQRVKLEGSHRKKLMNSQDEQKSAEAQSAASTTESPREHDPVHEVKLLNQKWETRMRQVKSNYESQIQDLRSEVDSFTRRITEKEKIERQRQDDIDKMLLLAKDRTEKEKKSKDEALRRLQVEQAQRQRAEENVLAERHRAETLSDRLMALQTQLASVTDLPPASPTRQQESLSSLGAMDPEELRTQVQILRQQVTIYKEDFDRERQDRERAQVERDTLQGGLTRLKADLRESNEMIRRREQEAELLRTENSCLRQEFQEIRQCEEDNIRLRTENTRLREQLRQRIEELQRQTSANAQQPSQARLVDPGNWWTAPVGSARRGGEPWECAHCTYSNIAVRSTCEMCGFPRSQPQTTRASRLISHGGWIECDQTSRGTPPNVTMGDDLVVDNEDQPDAPAPT